MSSGIGIALTKCYICGGDNEIVMNTRIGDKYAQEIEEMNGKCISYEPCPKCKEIMEQGVILIKVRDDDPDYRLGQMVVVKDEAIRKCFPFDDAVHLIDMRAGFIGESLWKKLGLPDGEVQND